MAIYFKGTLENNSLFLGNKTNVRECLKIILKNKADHKKNHCLLYPFLPTCIPPTQHILWHFLEITIHFWSYCYKEITVFPITRSTAVQEVAGSILRCGISFCGNISSYF